MALLPMNQLEMALEESLPELQQYSVRVSRRARNVSLQVLPLEGLLVTIPARFPRRDIPDVIRSNRDWIDRQMQRIARSTDPEFLLWPPEVLRLRALGSNLSVRYCEHGEAALRGRIQDDVLTVYGSRDTHWINSSSGRTALIALLGKLLKAEARRYLAPLCDELARLHGLEFARLSIRGQRTLWGSYSSSGTLSLNYKLLFLPPEYGRYIVLHELAHTRHLNHSAAFWRLLESMEPEARRLDRELNRVGRLVPPWL